MKPWKEWSNYYTCMQHPRLFLLCLRLISLSPSSPCSVTYFYFHLVSFVLCVCTCSVMIHWVLWRSCVATCTTTKWGNCTFPAWMNSRYTSKAFTCYLLEPEVHEILLKLLLLLMMYMYCATGWRKIRSVLLVHTGKDSCAVKAVVTCVSESEKKCVVWKMEKCMYCLKERFLYHYFS